jgi:disulfide bond formation protein DsbB
MLNRLPVRAVFAAICVSSLGLVGLAVYISEVMALTPCPMCILQRYAFVAIGLAALVATIHGPKGPWGVRVYAILVALFAMAGGGTSARHSYVQHFPPLGGSCGVELDYLVNTFPLAEALPKIFQGSGDCSKIDFSMLGITMPEWAGIWFMIFLATALWVGFFRKARA